MKEIGSKVWFIPDAYYPKESSGKFHSHDAVCVLNPQNEDAHIKMTLYFEDSDKKEGLKTVCKAERTYHIRMDKIRFEDGSGVPRGVPYAIMVESDVNIIVQYSRMDTTQAEMALMTTIAHPL